MTVVISAWKALLGVGLMAFLFNWFDVPINTWSLIAAFVGAFLIVHNWQRH